MHDGRGEIRDTGVALFVVIVVKESCAPAFGVCEATGIRGHVLRRFEARFGIVIVIAGAGSRKRLHHPKIFIQRVPILRGLNTAAITVRGELAFLSALAATRRFDEPLRQVHRFAIRQHPGDDVATV